MDIVGFKKLKLIFQHESREKYVVKKEAIKLKKKFYFVVQNCTQKFNILYIFK